MDLQGWLITIGNHVKLPMHVRDGAQSGSCPSLGRRPARPHPPNAQTTLNDATGFATANDGKTNVNKLPLKKRGKIQTEEDSYVKRRIGAPGVRT